MAGTDRPIVVGGGAAGLAACRTLEAAGHAPILLEAGDRLGGRLRTERMAGGTAVDRGFQVLLTAYPELRRWVDLAALDPVAFIPGAMIRKGGAWKTVADPRRLPGSILATLTSGVGTWGDRIRILRLVAQACSGDPLSVQNGLTQGTTMTFLRSEGFTDGFIRDFLQPFFSGIFLDASLSAPPAQFLYTLRMFASGGVVRPRQGIEAVVEQLAGGLEKTEVRLGTAVVDVESQSVGLADGSRIEGSCIISTIGGRKAVEWNAAFNAVFACGATAFGRPIIGLLPDADCVTNVHFMEDVQGAEGRGMLNVTALLPDPAQAGPASMEAHIRRDLDRAGLPVGDMVWHASIPQALPRMSSVASAPARLTDEAGVYLAGDHQAAPSLDAALRSGRLAAEAWMTTLS
ncbi:MAG: FAD-dependent oxidoreductase [Flavobacteriales bacterium]